MLPYTSSKLWAIDTSATRNEQADSTVWWGKTEFVPGQMRRWHVGPSTFWIVRLEFEWRLHQVERSNDRDAEVEVAAICPPEDVAEGASLDRFAVSSSGTTLSVTPLLADRPVVIRPETPLYVPSGEDVTLYVSTPLWLKLAAEDPALQLAERPVQRPSDTWFGPSTLVGELCYASRTSGRLRLSELPQRPHRAVTPVRIRNLAKDALLLQRVKVPVQYLTLYQSQTGGLWTQTATLVREQDGDLAALQLGRRAPGEATAAKQVSPPRQQAEAHLALRAFSRLFGSA
jgi:hypothetical protein